MSKQEIIYRQNLKDGLAQLREIVGEKKVLLFTGRNSFNRFEETILSSLNIKERIIIETANPQEDELNEFISKYDISADDTIYAIGGGSVLDSAKLISFCSANKIRVNEMQELKEKVMPLFIATPTTCGTGSESTQFATYYSNSIKKSLDDIAILPKIALLSADVLETLPQEVKSNTLADALCQAVESIWSISSTEESQEHAVLAIKEVVEAIEQDSLEKAILGANKAGQAIQITRTTACHAISYPITSRFGIPHGQAVSITLPELLLYNSKKQETCNDSRGNDYVFESMEKIYTAFGCKNVSETYEKVVELFKKLDMKTKLSELNIKKEDIDLIINEGGNPSRLGNNPWKLNHGDMRVVLEKIL